MTATTLAPPLTTTLVADVISGDALPVAAIGVDVRYRYPDGGSRQRRVVTDGDGRAVVVDRHPTRPEHVAVVAAGSEACIAATGAMTVVVEV